MIIASRFTRYFLFVVASAIIVAFTFFSVNFQSMAYVLGCRNKFKIFNSVVRSVEIFMIYLKAVRDWAIERLPQNSMGRKSLWLSIRRQPKVDIEISPNFSFKNSEFCIPVPSAAFSYLQDRAKTNAYFCADAMQCSAFCKKFLCQFSFVCRELFPSCNATAVSKIGYFVKTLKTDYRLPFFHWIFLARHMRNVNTVFA